MIGWVKAKDISTHSHSSVDRKTREFGIKGNGKGTNKAWGGHQDTVHAKMSNHRGKRFQVNLTEKVGNNIWYRGKINNTGPNVWLHSSQVGEYKPIKETETNYRLSLNAALNIQYDRAPFKMNANHGFVADVDINQNNIVKNSKAEVRTMPQTTNHHDNRVLTTLDKGTKIAPLEKNKNFYAINVNGSHKATALKNDIKQSMDPNANKNHEVNRFQFLDLRKRTGLTITEMNNELSNRGTMKNQGKAFQDASSRHGINEMYLIVHARLETGNGSSALASGNLEVGINAQGKPVLVTSSNRKNLKNIKPTYNMFGIGAVDSNPRAGGAIKAYEEGWDTPYKAIVGGAAWIKGSYIYNQDNQNTLYKMRWNPNMADGRAWKQYATDIDWANKQARLIYDIYQKTSKTTTLVFDYPTYN